MEITETQEFKNFINSIAYIGKSKLPNDNSDIYYSKVDNSYLTRVDMVETLLPLFKRGITTEIQSFGEGDVASIGFNKLEKKWYGWSNRAIYGFGIGDRCKIGDCGFIPSNKEEFKKSFYNFWKDSEYSKGDDKIIETKGKDYYNNIVEGVLLTYTYNDKVPNKSIRNTKYERFEPYPTKWGKGEWTATTLEEAKQMAIDFSNGVS